MIKGGVAAFFNLTTRELLSAEVFRRQTREETDKDGLFVCCARLLNYLVNFR